VCFVAMGLFVQWSRNPIQTSIKRPEAVMSAILPSVRFLIIATWENFERLRHVQGAVGACGCSEAMSRVGAA
jgi:hypothetical protein